MEAQRIAESENRKVLVLLIDFDELDDAEGSKNKEETVNMLDALDTASQASEDFIRVDEDSPKASTTAVSSSADKKEASVVEEKKEPVVEQAKAAVPAPVQPVVEKPNTVSAPVATNT